MRKKGAFASRTCLLCPYLFGKYPKGHTFSFRQWQPHNGVQQVKCAQKGICCPQNATGIVWCHHSLAVPQRVCVFVLFLQNRALSPPQRSQKTNKIFEKQNRVTMIFCIQEVAQTHLLKKKNKIVPLKCCKMYK